jgi:basic membrane protein A
MRARSRRHGTFALASAFATALALGLVAAGCGGGSEATRTAGTAGSGERPIRVGLVTDIGGLNDRSFNHLAYVGLQRAVERLGVEGRVVTSESAADYVPNLSTLARQHYDLVIGVGFLMADAVDTAARRFPKTNFAIVDFSQGALSHKPGNVAGLLFKEQEAGYLAGYLAGLMLKRDSGREIVSSVGGQKIPPVDRYIAGFQAGARAAAPSIRVLNGYSQDFVDQAKCKELALNQIARGSRVVFQVAGGCGLGALDAARQKHVWGIGVDADQAYLGPQILTSALKKVDNAVYSTIGRARAGTLSGGDTTFDVANGGVGLGRLSAKVPAKVRTEVEAVREQIAAGELTIPAQLR